MKSLFYLRFLLPFGIPALCNQMCADGTTTNVHLKIAFIQEQTMWRAGNPLRIEVRLQNKGKEPIIISEGLHECDPGPVFDKSPPPFAFDSLSQVDFKVTLNGPDGKPVPETKAGRDLQMFPGSRRYRQMKPNETRIYHLRLDRHYNFSQKGAYHIKVRRYVGKMEEQTHTNDSNTLILNVQPSE